MKNQLVEVYRNLNKNCWSIRQRGIVIDHMDELLLIDVEYKVSEAGRQRVLKEKRKNVHAYAKGILTEIKTHDIWKNGALYQIKYNPYKLNSFYILGNKKPIYNSNYALFCKDGKVLVG